MPWVIYIHMYWLWMNIKNKKQWSGMNEWRPDGKLKRMMSNKTLEMLFSFNIMYADSYLNTQH